MANTAAQLLAELLKIYNDGATEFKKLVGDKTKSIPAISGTIKINDFDEGAIANGLEFNRKISQDYVNELNLNTAIGDWIDYVGENFYRVSRDTGESDADYVQRIKDTVFQIGATKPKIQQALDNLSIPNTTLTVHEFFNEFCFYVDLSFLDFDEYVESGGTIVATPAIVNGNSHGVWYFEVWIDTTLTTPQLNVYAARIIDTVEAFRSAGIDYLIRIV